MLVAASRPRRWRGRKTVAFAPVRPTMCPFWASMSQLLGSSQRTTTKTPPAKLISSGLRRQWNTSIRRSPPRDAAILTAREDRRQLVIRARGAWRSIRSGCRPVALRDHLSSHKSGTARCGKFATAAAREATMSSVPRSPISSDGRGRHRPRCARCWSGGSCGDRIQSHTRWIFQRRRCGSPSPLPKWQDR